MAALALPLLEAAAVRVLAVLGVGAATGIAVETARKAAQERSQEAERATATPLARADTCATAAGAQHPACKTCPPVLGSPYLRNTAGWSNTTISYQLRIGAMPPGPPGYLTEWLYNGVHFDGFEPGQCLLKEAKARYDQFFDELGDVQPWWTGSARTVLAEAGRQNAAAQPRPPVRLRWHFMQPKSYAYFAPLIREGNPGIEVLHQP
jgi:Restriction endonuclease fold toxin 5